MIFKPTSACALHVHLCPVESHRWLLGNAIAVETDAKVCGVGFLHAAVGRAPDPSDVSELIVAYADLSPLSASFCLQLVVCSGFPVVLRALERFPQQVRVDGPIEALTRQYGDHEVRRTSQGNHPPDSTSPTSPLHLSAGSGSGSAGQSPLSAASSFGSSTVSGASTTPTSSPMTAISSTTSNTCLKPEHFSQLILQASPCGSRVPTITNSITIKTRECAASEVRDVDSAGPIDPLQHIQAGYTIDLLVDTSAAGQISIEKSYIEVEIPNSNAEASMLQNLEWSANLLLPC
jgi:hypothetical protein